MFIHMTDNVKELLTAIAEQLSLLSPEDRQYYRLSVRADVLEELVEYVNKIEDEKRLLIHKVQNNE